MKGIVLATLFLRSHSRTPSYYLRFLVPAFLRGILAQREVWKCLWTANYQEAKLRASIWEGKVSRLLLTVKENRAHMTPNQITSLVQQYLSASIQEAEEERLTRTLGDDEREAISLGLMNALENTESRLMQNDFSRISSEADELLFSHQIPFDNQSPEYKRLCRELLIAKQKLLKLELDRIDGNYWNEPLALTVVDAGHDRSTLSLVASRQVAEIMTLYFKENQRKPRTDAQIQSGFEKFIQVIGGDRPIQEINKSECRRYKEILLKLPRAMSAVDRKRNLQDVLGDLPDTYQTIGLSSVNKYLHSLAHFFDWSKRQGFYEGENPAHGLTISKRHIQGKEKRKRKPFTENDLKLIFGSEDYRKQRAANPERFWIPLILLHTGARREEIAQLDIADLKQEQGVWFFHITPDEERGKALKNAGSKRRVPVHSYLLEREFLRYVQQVKGGGEDRLFPGLVKGRNGYGDAVGKWFGRLLDKVGVNDPSKVIHSFRHTVNTKLHEMRVPPAYILSLIGHEGESVNERDYLHGKEFFAITLLKEEIEKLDFRVALKGLEDSSER